MSALTPSSDPRGRLARLPQLRRWISVPLLLVLVTLILGFAVKLNPRLSGAEFRIDELLSRDHIAVGNAIALTIDALLSPPGIIIILLVLFVFLLVVRRSPVNAFAVTSVATVGWLSSEVFKLLVAQPRPDEHLLHNPLIPSDGSGSFPSGHTTFAVAIAIAICFLARGTRWAAPAAIVGLGFALLVAGSRLYLGVHYPSDVLGSFLVAPAAICLYTGLWNRYGMRVLNWIPFLDRIGPIPSRLQLHDRPARRTAAPEGL
ncbi:phosphatase PAP2 family protein [Cryobacterium sp. Hz9]|uniref:phosphatase PAP2 family protein n=1 Tax=Cryobacterium sp. Hz9 TaxID=1259167 RepID=UPI001F54529A|nr:phosphatase PAP2 family protein [Cryobacterium sp. Hz9]